MRKRINFRQLGRDSEHRWAMLRNMVTSLIKHERIMTTTARAKELRRVADKMITHAKKGDLHHQRLAGAVVREKPALVKLFEILGPRYKERCGGYTRVMKLGRPRKGDSADMSFIEEGELRKARPPVNRYPTPAATTTPAPSSVVMAAVRAQQENASAAK
eukprot:scaffold521_cov177-Ochromonas_danica.AAC.23